MHDGNITDFKDYQVLSAFCLCTVIVERIRIFRDLLKIVKNSFQTKRWNELVYSNKNNKYAFPDSRLT